MISETKRWWFTFLFIVLLGIWIMVMLRAIIWFVGWLFETLGNGGAVTAIGFILLVIFAAVIATAAMEPRTKVLKDVPVDEEDWPGPKLRQWASKRPPIDPFD